MPTPRSLPNQAIVLQTDAITGTPRLAEQLTRGANGDEDEVADELKPLRLQP